MQFPFVEPVARADGREVDAVGVVRDERDARVDRLSVDRDPEVVTMRQQRRPRTDACERRAPAAVMLAPMHEPRIHAERHVVQKEPPVCASDVDSPFGAVECAQRVERSGPVEPEVAREVVARSERDAHEGHTALERDFGDGRERPVAAGNAERLRR